jgi:predicted amidophosphoribosyltransferase
MDKADELAAELAERYGWDFGPHVTGRCTRCGSDLAPEYRYCPQCGHKRDTPVDPGALSELRDAMRAVGLLP